VGKRLAWRVSECVEVQVRAGVEAGAMLKPELVDNDIFNEPVNSASRCTLACCGAVDPLQVLLAA
jgi:class 3 adenylate cyclase